MCFSLPPVSLPVSFPSLPSLSFSSESLSPFAIAAASWCLSRVFFCFSRFLSILSMADVRRVTCPCPLPPFSVDNDDENDTLCVSPGLSECAGDADAADISPLDREPEAENDRPPRNFASSFSSASLSAGDFAVCVPAPNSPCEAPDALRSRMFRAGGCGARPSPCSILASPCSDAPEDDCLSAGLRGIAVLAPEALEAGAEDDGPD